jgi:hypothetical protein
VPFAGKNGNGGAGIAVCLRRVLMADDNELVMQQCKYPGCGKVVRAYRHMMVPPPGWAWIDYARYGEGLYCEQHAEEVEKLILQETARGY